LPPEDETQQSAVDDDEELEPAVLDLLHHPCTRE